MKAKILFLLCSVLFLNSCNIHFGKAISGSGNIVKERRELSAFSKIENGSIFNVYVIQGATSSAIIEIDDNLLQYVELSVDGDKLEIKSKDVQIQRVTKGNIYVTAQSLTAFENNGTGDVSIGELASIVDFKCQNNGTGDIALNFSCGNLRIENNGTGDFKYTGSCKSIDMDNGSTGDVQLNGMFFDKLKANNNGTGDLKIIGKTPEFILKNGGTGDVDALSLKADLVDVDYTGTGDLKINAEKELTISSSGTGDVMYRCSGVVKSVANSGTGEVKKIN